MIQSHHFYAILPAAQTVFNWETADFIKVIKNAAHIAQLTIVGELAYAFQPQGVSAVILLAESHVALHFGRRSKSYNRYSYLRLPKR